MVVRTDPRGGKAMKIGTRKQAGTGRLFRFGYVILAVAACSAAAASYAIAGQVITPDGQRVPTAASGPLTPTGAAAPSAAAFAAEFTGVTNAYAKANGDPARVTHADCVRASRDHYMCSYAITRPARPSECHLMQAVWTPRALSSFTVTLSGRVNRCGSLRAALRSLR
jgi:hypothetical protein